MNALWAVYKREVGVFFRSPIAYAIAFGLMLFLGVLFSASVNSAVLQNQSGFAQQPITADLLFQSNLAVLVFLMFIVAPLLTMRLISEEAREGTLEVLMTLPMGDWAFVLGKFLAVWTFYTVILALTLAHTLMLDGIGVLDGGVVFGAYLGAWLYGGATLALAMIWSAITEDQIVAAFLGSATVLVLFLADGLAQLAGTQDFTRGAANFIRELSLQSHYQNTMLEGIIRAEDIAYFVFVMIAAVFLTTLIVGTRRWRAS
ncbi:MAG: ABC transporter permease [Anaerolineae bacterium]|nr:ABC transporter permease [Anaerolineae bacterium]MDW8173460.1 ABC transporter permease [Anaerolineae bacterium]